MSWIIQHLLKNSLEIKETKNLDYDAYDNLIIVEKKIKDMYNDGYLSEVDMKIIDLVADGKSIISMEVFLDKNRLTISKTFIQICNRISYFLGGYFTDDGFLYNMKINYRLSDSDILKIKYFISGNFKHKLMRKIKTHEPT